MPYEVTCNRCRRVSFAIPKEVALREIEQFNTRVAIQPAGSLYELTPMSLDTYRCRGCGTNDRGFRKFTAGDAPDGVTLAPVIVDADLYHEVREDYEKAVLTGLSNGDIDLYNTMERLGTTHADVVQLMLKYGIDLPDGV